MLKRIFLSFLLIGVSFSVNAMKNSPVMVDYYPKEDLVIASLYERMFTLSVEKNLNNGKETIGFKWSTSGDTQIITLKSHPSFTPEVIKLKTKIALWREKLTKEQSVKKQKKDSLTLNN